MASSGDDQVFRLPACTATRRQPAGPDQHPVTRLTVEVAMTCDRTVIFPCKERIEQAVRHGIIMRVRAGT